MSFVMPAAGEFYVAAARNRLEGVIPVHKFGLAQNIQAAEGWVDVWDGVHPNETSNITPYNWIEDGPVGIQVSSTNAADVGVEVSGEGLDENWELAVGNIVLNGQTPVVATGILRQRVFRAYNSGSQEALGDIYISDAGTPTTGGVPDDLTKVRAIIRQDAQQTQMALYTVPKGYELLVTHAWTNVARETATAGVASVRVFKRTFGGVFRVVHTLAISVNGAPDHRPYELPIRFDEQEDLIYRTTVSANGMGVSAGFHGILIKK